MGTNKRISDWIKKQVKDAGAKGCVLGLSGGLDSALVSKLCSSAVGRGKVLCVIMPCHSSEKDKKDAVKVARKLNLKYKVIDLSPVYDVITRILPAADRLTKANIKPRLRMITLYYFARKMNYIVAGTGNKSELNAGYFTKYGDGGVDILPIGDILKTEVRKLSAEAGIPESIIERPPSAGLWEGQTDEGEMGMSYEELDGLISLIEKGKRPSGAKAAKLHRMKKASAHKLCPIPMFKK